MIGGIANNRFLQRVNPQISRALADSGSSLASDEIQPLMRQMVDLGVADNLKLWVHSGLVKTRTSGSDLFVPKAYDISGEEKDPFQATEANQPKLVSLGMGFDGSNDSLRTSGFLNNTSHTVLAWFKKTNNTVQNLYEQPGSSSLVLNTSNTIRMYDWNASTWRTSTTNVYSLNTWSFLSVRFVHGINTTNAAINTINQFTTTWGMHPTVNSSGVFIARFENNTGFFGGEMNDFRLIQELLTDTQISAIYNATKSKYGH